MSFSFCPAGPSRQNHFLQRRLAAFGKAMTILTVLGLGVEVILDILLGHLQFLKHPVYGFALMGLVLYVGLWVVARGEQRSEKVLYRFEALVLLGSTVLYALMGRYLNTQIYPDMVAPLNLALVPEAFRSVLYDLVQNYVSAIMVLCFSQAMILRAALVPSSGQRTVGLCIVMAVPLFVITGLGYVPVHADQALRDQVPFSNRVLTGLVSVVFWILTTATSAIISKVIYSLHKEVHEALQLGQYTLQEKLGEGGMGMVYRAKHAMMRRPTAVKLLLPERAGEEHLARFEREVQLTAKLTHPNTITVFDYGRTPEGILYYAMEYLEGATLEQIVQVSGPLHPGRVLRVLKMCAGALAEAHGIGLIHRDIKPSNIVLCERGGEQDFVKVLDFGLVKDLTATQESLVLTDDRQLPGTPLYMSPETLTSPHSIDGRSDLYALGAVGYYLLTGCPVFEGQTVVEVCGHHLHSPPVPPSKRLGAKLPGDLEQLVLDCLEKAPESRPPSARALLARLEACQEVPLWTADEAAGWWESYASELESRRSTLVGSEQGQALAVDWTRARS